MTVAVCHNCGEFKWGAFNPCEKCGAHPRTDAELALSLTMSDHHFDESALKRFGDEIHAGRPPSVDPVLIRNSQEMLTSPAGLKMRATFAAMLDSAPKPSATPKPENNKWADPTFTGFASQIAAIVCRHFRAGVGAVTYRMNHFLDPSLVKMARELFKKPFLASWNKFLPEQGLRIEPMFEVLAPAILMTGRPDEARNQFWDGTGKYLTAVKLADISSFTGPARLSPFAISLGENVYSEVLPYLETPSKE